MLNRSGGDNEDKQGPWWAQARMGGMEESVGWEMPGYVQALCDSQQWGCHTEQWVWNCGYTLYFGTTIISLEQDKFHNCSTNKIFTPHILLFYVSAEVRTFCEHKRIFMYSGFHNHTRCKNVCYWMMYWGHLVTNAISHAVKATTFSVSASKQAKKETN
jgi:hypothetical protein